ncbi:MAG TPA: cytochrome c oxidase assembly factor Coa1 family protein, partial [Pirellulales bacterium]|nr:cytochrome c oxidase assembly factor Coa1 family protein [Pirellulales bacterium]
KEVNSELGGPIHGGWTPHGTVDWNSPIPEANLNFTISGTKGSADVAVLARKIDGVWGFPRFDVTLHGEDNLPGKRIDVAGEINRERPPDVPVFDAATQKLASKPKIEEAPPDLNIKIDVDPPGGGK